MARASASLASQPVATPQGLVCLITTAAAPSLAGSAQRWLERIEIEQVVVAELFALQLLGTAPSGVLLYQAAA